MAAGAVRESFDQRRAAPAASSFEHTKCGVVDRIHVVAIDDDPLQAVCGCPVGGRMVNRRDEADRRVLHIEVVLTHKDHRQVPDRCEVQCLVERSDVGGAVPEEAHGRLAAVAQLGRPGRTVGQREMGADDGVRAHHAALCIREVHRTTFAAHEPVLPAEQLGKHAIHRSTLGESVGMAAVGGKYVVIGTHRVPKTGGDRLHSQREVARALDQVLQEQVVRPLFELAQFLKPGVETQPGFVAQGEAGIALGSRCSQRPRGVVVEALVRLNTHWRPSTLHRGTA